MDKEYFMRRAIALSEESLRTGGGPFGAVVVKADAIIGEGKNSVVPGLDPTAHAEIVAIRAACRNLRTYDLSGSVVFTSCEPCPMCLGAIWWARIEKIYYGNTRAEAAAIGFDDEAIYREIGRPPAERRLPLVQLAHEEALRTFDKWRVLADKTMY